MPARNFTINGSILSLKNRQPLGGLKIEAWGKDMPGDQPVGSNITDNSGAFNISFTARHFKELFIQNTPELYFKIYHDDKLIRNTEDSILWNIKNPGKDVEILIDINQDDNPGTSTSVNFRGYVKHVNGNVIAQMRIAISEQKLRDKILLAETISNINGAYTISLDGPPGKPAFVLEAVDTKGTTLASAGPVFMDAADRVIDLIISDVDYKGEPFFTQRKPILQPYSNELQNSKIQKPLSVEDVFFTAKQTGQEPRDTFHWLRAGQLEAATKIPAEAFYGFYRQGLPTDPRALSAKDPKTLKDALIKSASESFVSDETVQHAGQIIEQWNGYNIQNALNQKPGQLDASLGDILSIAVKDTEMQQQILHAYLEHTGTIEEFWKNLPKVTGNEEMVKQTRTTLQLSVLAGNQPVMTKALLDETTKSKMPNPLKQLAALDQSDWTGFINSLSAREKKSVVPIYITGNNEEEKVKKYAQTISKTLEQTFPTHSFFGKLEKEPAANGPFSTSRNDLLAFYSNNPGFDIVSTPTISIGNEGADFNFQGIKNKELLIGELQSIQRLSVYTTDFSVMNVLKKDGLDSAYMMMQVPQPQFIRNYTPAFGSVEQTVLAYKQAEKNYMQSAMIWSKYLPGLNFNLTVTAPPVTDPTIRSMFGSPDACECEHCTSVFSAAAYYADILNFLYSRTPEVYNELIRRRPDLPHILLTCENTNTPLPYVDLVNELLENFILTHKDPPEAVPDSYQTTWQAQELAANPENLTEQNYKAYDELEAAVFPHILPFNFPLEETRVYLKHLGVQRHQLMATFFGGTETESFDDFNICMERLLISPQQAKILTGETKGDITANSGAWNFYGFDKAHGYKPLIDPMDSGKQISGGSWVDALSGRVDVFLQQTDLVFKEMLTMLLCDFINPADKNGTRKITIVAKEKDEDGTAVPPDTCQPNLLELKGLDADDLKKIHRFLRLWRRLGWGMYDLDKATKAFGITDFNNDGTRKDLIDYFTKGDLTKISQTDFLYKELRLSIGSTLAFWADIGSIGYIDYFTDNYPPVISLYERLFRSKAVLNPVDETFTEDPSLLTGSMDDHTATIFAAIQISDIDYSYLVADPSVLADTNLAIENLSSLYRHTAMAKKLKLSVQDFLTLKSLAGINPFNDPKSAFEFLTKADTVRTSGFSIDLISYLLRHEYLEETATAPTNDTISVFLSELRASMRAIETSTDDEQKNTIAQKFSEKLGISTTAAILLLHNYVKSTANALKAIEDDFWAGDFAGSDFLKTYVDTADPLNLIEFEPVFVRDTPADATQVSIAVLFDDYMKLDKIATFINKLKLSDTELENILMHSATIGCTDFTALPVAVSAADFDAFETLINLIKSRDQLPIGTPEYFDILNHAIDIAPAATGAEKQEAKDLWLADLSTRTNWERETIETLVGTKDVLDNAGMLITNFPTWFRNGDLIQHIKICLDTLNKIGLSTALIEDAIQEDVDDVLSQAIKNAAKAKYDEPQWFKIAKPLRDDLREKQRESLVAYVVTRPDGSKHERWKNSDELYEYLLIDVEMKPISMTSRMKQAICSVQLFIDRVLMNLEHPDSDLSKVALKLEGDQVEEWKEWRKLYRVWEANRKIFLYPENWLEPELRDDKSPFFKELETQLKQNELTDDNVEDAFHSYLEKLDGVARLQVVGLYHQTEDATEEEDAVDILHVIARTFVNPHKYYHRTLEDGEWTSWIKLEIDVDGDHIVPVVFNRRLCLFWLFFTQESEENDSLDPNDTVESPARYWKIQIAWSEFKKNKWTPKKVSENYVESEHMTNVETHVAMKTNLIVRNEIADDTLKLYLFSSGGSFIYEGETRSIPVFIFEDTSNDPEVADDELLTATFSLFLPDSTDNIEMMVKAKNTEQPLAINYAKYVNNPAGGSYGYIDDVPVLNNCTEKKFKLVLPAAEYEPYGSHFFFQDAKNTFYVEHSLVNTSIFTTPDIAIGDWEKGLIDVWGGMIEIDPIPHPIDPIYNPDDFFADAGLDYSNIDFSSAGNFGIDRVGPGGNVLPHKINNGGATLPTKMKSVSHTDNSMISIKDFSAINYGNAGLFDEGRLIYDKYIQQDQFTFKTFYHAHVKTFIKELNKLGIDGLLTRDVQTQDDTILFDASYDPAAVVKKDYATNEIDFVYGGPYAQYNWELFFHVPMLIACRLSGDQRFEEARDWFHYIFDPTSSEGGDVERFWQFKPFYDEAGTEIETLDELLRNEAELEAQVEKWMDNPFMPHVIARMRISAYMRNVVMKYLDNLVAWGDNLFRHDTIESINEATNLYILSAKILGERPQEIPPRAEHADTDFDDIKDELDAFSNALVQIETFISPSASSTGTESSGTSNAIGEMFYFCVPRNEYLMKYWDTVADRLFKIRHSMNIEGIVRTLPLFEPPIDPGMLVRAAAAGMDLSSILSDLNAPLPHYRFTFILQKANELVNDVKSLGGALLQALEKRDAEAISLLRSGHEQRVLQSVLAIKEKQVDDSKESLESVKKSLEIANLKYQYYNTRPFMNSYEQQHLNSTQTGLIFTAIQGEIETIAGTLSAIPNLKIGAPTSMGVTWGGDNLASMMRAISSYIGIFAAINNTQGIMSSTLGGYTRRMDDWKFQASSSAKEIQQLEMQVISSEIKLAIAEKDLSNQQLQIDNAAEADDFMHSKFSNQQLYEWMIGQLSTVYFQSYQLAYDMAKKAEQCYQYELGQYGQTSFIQFGYWDSLKKGLLSAEKLQYDLRRMETSFYEENVRELELSKNISLTLLTPQAILDLRGNGKCTVIIPEALYDLDYQGHYFRRLKSVSLSIPCIAGPYTTINCTLRLLKHTIRVNTDGADYSSDDYSADERFRHITTEIRSIATSNAQNDSGVFELSFRDERYLPFEGCGAFGEWEIVLNENQNLRLFDYNTISDVIMQVKYTAREDAGAFKISAANYLDALIKETIAPSETSGGIQLWRMFSSRHEFPGEWYKLFHPSDGSAQIMQFEIAQSRFPFFTQNREIQIKAVHVYGFFYNSDDYTVVITPGSGIATAQTLELRSGNNYHDSKDVSGVSFALGSFTLTVSKGIAPAALTPAAESDITDLILMLEYQCVSS